MKDFYVYLHRKATTGEIFYVGKGKDDRLVEDENRNKHWRNTVKKHGLTVEIVLDGLQEWYALELEISLIALYGRKDLGLGPLVNMTDGGDGVSGLKFSEESRLKMSAAQVKRFEQPGAKESKVISDENRQKINAAVSTPEHREKLRSIHTAPEMVAMHCAALHSPAALEKHRLTMGSEETRSKLRAAAKTKPPVTAETRAKRSASLKGRTFSVESREKLRAAAKADWAKRKAASL